MGFFSKVFQIEIMEVRYQELKESIDGLIQTGIPLITYDGKNFGSLVLVMILEHIILFPNCGTF